MKARLSRRSIATTRCISISAAIAFAMVVLMPNQAFAQSCNAQVQSSVLTPTPYFLLDPVEIRIGIGATNIDLGTTIAINQFSYKPDCQSGSNFFNCIDQPNDLEFLGLTVTQQTCENEAGDPIVWSTSETTQVDFTATNGPAVIPADSVCFVTFEVRANSISPVTYPKSIYGRSAFENGLCDNGEGASAAGQLTYALESCALDLVKEVSVNGGTTWFDANDPNGPDLEVVGDALYRLLLENTGTADYVGDITINDAALGITNATVPGLASGGTATVGSGDILALFAEGRCSTAGALNNVSTADALCRVDSPVSASDSDNAWVNCVPPPSIDITKYVSVDGGTTFFDANELDKSDWPPAVEYPSGAEYYVEVCNDGAVDLEDVVVNDSELGVTDYLVGDLAAGDCVDVDSGDIPAFLVAERCDAAGIFDNIATADGNSALTGTPATQAEDPANMECVPPPEISIQKYIRLPGTLAWLDADTVGAAPSATFPSGAEYQIVVCNTGDVDLVDVTVVDATLGINENVGSLAVGDCETLDEGTYPSIGLNVAERCDAPGSFENVASATGDSDITGSTAGPVQDPAWLVCTPPGNEICRTIGFWGARGGDEKAPKSQNVTQAVICDASCGGDATCQADCMENPDNYAGLDVCGTSIKNTDLMSEYSAIEAICASPKGDPQVQLMRQLTGASLNCVLGECNDYHATLVADCNVICAANDDAAAMNQCKDELDCFNNGGAWDDIGGFCYYPGTCSASGDPCFDTDEEEGTCPPVINTDVPVDNYCVLDESCHDRLACPDAYDDGEVNDSDLCFEPLGPASSPKKCSAARKNEVYVP